MQRCRLYTCPTSITTIIVILIVLIIILVLLLLSADPRSGGGVSEDSCSLHPRSLRSPFPCYHRPPPPTPPPPPAPQNLVLGVAARTRVFGDRGKLMHAWAAASSKAGAADADDAPGIPDWGR